MFCLGCIRQNILAGGGVHRKYSRALRDSSLIPRGELTDPKTVKTDQLDENKMQPRSKSKLKRSAFRHLISRIFPTIPEQFPTSNLIPTTPYYITSNLKLRLDSNAFNIKQIKHSRLTSNGDYTSPYYPTLRTLNQNHQASQDQPLVILQPYLDKINQIRKVSELSIIFEDYLKQAVFHDNLDPQQIQKLSNSILRRVLRSIATLEDDAESILIQWKEQLSCKYLPRDCWSIARWNLHLSLINHSKYHLEMSNQDWTSLAHLIPELSEKEMMEDGLVFDLTTFTALLKENLNHRYGSIRPRNALALLHSMTSEWHIPLTSDVLALVSLSFLPSMKDVETSEINQEEGQVANGDNNKIEIDFQPRFSSITAIHPDLPIFLNKAFAYKKEHKLQETPFSLATQIRIYQVAKHDRICKLILKDLPGNRKHTMLSKAFSQLQLEDAS